MMYGRRAFSRVFEITEAAKLELTLLLNMLPQRLLLLGHISDVVSINVVLGSL